MGGLAKSNMRFSINLSCTSSLFQARNFCAIIAIALINFVKSPVAPNDFANGYQIHIISLINHDKLGGVWRQYIAVNQLSCALI